MSYPPAPARQNPAAGRRRRQLPAGPSGRPAIGCSSPGHGRRWRSAMSLYGCRSPPPSRRRRCTTTAAPAPAPSGCHHRYQQSAPYIPRSHFGNSLRQARRSSRVAKNGRSAPARSWPGGIPPKRGRCGLRGTAKKGSANSKRTERAGRQLSHQRQPLLELACLRGVPVDHRGIAARRRRTALRAAAIVIGQHQQICGADGEEVLIATVLCESSGTARKGRETQGKAVITAFKRED
eukprot:SAG22_NODE_1817_length_3516_cov_34.397425_1_plen_235_part_10